MKIYRLADVAPDICGHKTPSFHKTAQVSAGYLDLFEELQQKSGLETTESEYIKSYRAAMSGLGSMEKVRQLASEIKERKLNRRAQTPPPVPPQNSQFRCPDIRIGDVIMVGKYKQVETSIAGFGIDENGQPTLISSDGIESKMFTFRLAKLMPGEGESH